MKAAEAAAWRRAVSTDGLFWVGESRLGKSDGGQIWQLDFRALIISPAMMINWLLFCLLDLSFWAIQWPISAFIAAISVLLSAFEHISALLFEFASDLYGVPPRASFPTEKCAVLILGAHEGAPITLYNGIKHRRPAFIQVWEETRHFRFLSWAIPSLHCVPIDRRKSLDPI
jgi:hypothetical protein